MPNLPEADQLGFARGFSVLQRAMQAPRPWQLGEREVRDQRAGDRRIDAARFRIEHG